MRYSAAYPTDAPAPQTPTADAPLNLNTAAKEELMLLPRIGETLADGEALAIGLGDDLQSLVLADEVFQVLPTSELMAFRGVKRLEVGGHNRCFVFSG